MVLLHTWIACLNPENFKDAAKYMPERWLKPTTPHSPMLVAPFGAGKRICPGKRFVELGLQLVLAKVRTYPPIETSDPPSPRHLVIVMHRTFYFRRSYGNSRSSQTGSSICNSNSFLHRRAPCPLDSVTVPSQHRSRADQGSTRSFNSSKSCWRSSCSISRCYFTFISRATRLIR